MDQDEDSQRYDSAQLSGIGDFFLINEDLMEGNYCSSFLREIFTGGVVQGTRLKICLSLIYAIILYVLGALEISMILISMSSCDLVFI